MSLRPFVLLSVFVALGCSSAKVEPSGTSKSAVTTGGAILGMPFDGYFDKFGDTSPNVHHRVVGGNWATDIYASPGTAVRYQERTGAIARVVSIMSACVGGGPSLGGSQIQLSLSDAGDGVALGTVFYLHLATPQVSVGQSIESGTVLGYTAQWESSSCYQVSNAGGVHTHFEVKSAVGSSCFTTVGGGDLLGDASPIGRLGGGDMFGVCPSSVSAVAEEPTSGCVCDGVDVDNQSVVTTTCGAPVCGLDRQVWTCGAKGFAGGGGPC